jgi:hypothetical protein
LKRKFYWALGAFASLALGGCGFGLRVPEIQEAWDSPDDGEALVREISKSVYLSVEKAVVCVMNDGKTFVNEASKEAFRKNWAAQMTLQLTIQESTTLSPGLSLNTPMHNGVVNFAGEYFGSSTASFGGPWAPFVSGYPSTSTFGPLPVAQSYSLGFGGKANAQATRTETSGAFFTVASLVNNAKKNDRFEAEKSTCDNQTIDEEARNRLYHNQQSKELSKTAQFLSLITNNDLKIYEWLKSVLHIQNIIAGMGGGTVGTSNDSSKSPGVGQNAITHEVQFVVLTDGNVTPSWRLVRVSANQSSPLFDTQRQRTHDLIVTFGPKDPKTGGLQSEATATHNAALFGLSNVNGIRGIIQP